MFFENEGLAGFLYDPFNAEKVFVLYVAHFHKFLYFDLFIGRITLFFHFCNLFDFIFTDFFISASIQNNIIYLTAHKNLIYHLVTNFFAVFLPFDLLNLYIFIYILHFQIVIEKLRCVL